jgi:hypothetical protein
MRELDTLLGALKKEDAGKADTWRWAAMEIYMQAFALPENSDRDRVLSKALFVAREAQSVINHFS